MPLASEDRFVVRESLELDGVAAWIREEAGVLFAYLPLETHLWLYQELRVVFNESRDQVMPLLNGQDQSEVANRNGLAIDSVRTRNPVERGVEVGNKLMPKEIEVDPISRTTTLAASEQIAIEPAR